MEEDSSEHVNIVPPTPSEDKPGQEGGGALGGLQTSSMTPQLLQTGASGSFSGPGTKSLFVINKKISGTDTSMTPEEQFLFSLATPSTSKSVEGKILFKELFIPPPPPASVPSDDQVKQKSVSKVPSNTGGGGAGGGATGQGKGTTALDGSGKRRSSTSPDKRKTGGGGGGAKKSGGAASGSKLHAPKMSEKEKLQYTKRDTFCPAGKLLMLLLLLIDYIIIN